MTYRLNLDATMHDVYASLPDEARRDLAACLLDAMGDPIAHSTVYGEDDGVLRTVARGLVTAAILVNAMTKTITVLQITFAG